VKWLRGVGVLFLVGVVATVIDWEHQGWRVKHTIAELRQKFTIGMQLQSVHDRVIAAYPRNTEYSVADCSKWAKTTSPAYEAQGGPCIFGIVETGSAWWGFESAVSFRLIFDPKGTLLTVQVYPEYTFL
jgi:hypothetical protein